MAFVVVAVTIFLASTCFQSFFAAVAMSETTASTVTTSSAAASPLGIMNPANPLNSLNPVNFLYNSPYIPTSEYYGVGLLDEFPFFCPCDCNFASLIDPTLMSEIALITARYNQRSCSVQQWERLINKNMPGIDAVNALNMLSSLSAALQREQIRRNLVYGNYPEVCLNYATALDDLATTTVSTSSATAATVLTRREPQVAATTSATTTTVTNTKAPWNDTPYFYTMQYLFDRALPNLSADLRLDVISAVLANTPPTHWNMAYTLAQQLTANIRGMVSDMVDLSMPSVSVTY